MVDPGFLLITFFVITSVMSESKAMNIIVPNDKDSTHDPICETCALSIIADGNDKIFYYPGIDKNAVYQTATYGAALRKIILQRKKYIEDHTHKDRLILIIKPTSHSHYKNLVDIIDESVICKVKKYYVAD